MNFFKRKKTTEQESNATTAAKTNEELIAVITAAISAYEGERYVQTLSIKKINRIAGVRPIWSATGTDEAIDIRRI